MAKSVLIKTNLLVSLVILLGYLIAAFLTYHSSIRFFMSDVEDISSLTSEGIYYRLESFFARPVNVSLTMANDSLLKNLLERERGRLNDSDYVETIRDYLNAYRLKYDYDSVFLVSTATGRYYNFQGIDRNLTPDNPENDWYYNFLSARSDYGLEVDNDEAAGDEITVFVNCRIKDDSGRTMGVVGVGLRVENLQAMLDEYEKELGVKTLLISREGIIQVSTERTGYERVNHFDTGGYGHLREAILVRGPDDQAKTFWLTEKEKIYIVSKYVPDLSWYLIVEHDISRLNKQMRQQLFRSLGVVLIITAMVLMVIRHVIKGYKGQIEVITSQREAEHQAAFRAATEQLYDSIQEINVSRNRAAAVSTETYFKSFGLPGDVPFSEALKVITERQVKEEFREGYLNTFLPENILREYRNGNSRVSYEFLMSLDGRHYYWTRIVAHLYKFNEDDSIRMFAYYQNIDEQKRQELKMAEQIQLDAMTGLYNKTATQSHIESALSRNQGQMQAFFIFDIDDFKQINDQCGHDTGDQVIMHFASLIKQHFRREDVVGRIGGDEFAVFVPVSGRAWVEEKARELTKALDSSYSARHVTCRFSASIGIALAPDSGNDFETLYKNADQALYATKKRGKNGYTVYGD